MSKPIPYRMAREINLELLTALKGAKEQIKSWHHLALVAMPKEYYDRAWEIYEQNAPEMRPINEAIRNAEAAL